LSPALWLRRPVSRRIKQISAGDEDLVSIRVAGLEPASFEAPEPKSGMSTNSTTPALSLLLKKVEEALRQQELGNSGLEPLTNSL
jgi:hypothetical protein